MAVDGGARFLENLYKDWSARMAAEPALPLSAVRSLFDEWQKPTMEAESVSYRNDTIGGVDGLWALPAGADQNKGLLYAHGGGFMAGSSSSHRKLGGHLAKALNLSVFLLDYRLAPEHPFPAQMDDMTAAYRALLDAGHDSENVSLGGDSAGSSIAISSALNLRDMGLPAPKNVICFSPWVDIELKSPSLWTSGETDHLVPRPSGPELVAMFLGENTPSDNPLANPLYADFTGFPRLYINVGAGEALLDDAIRLHDRATAAGVDSTISSVGGMQHVFPVLAGRAIEADNELNRLATWLNPSRNS
jgi:monoterpene epsilon-lactone hydrolase